MSIREIVATKQDWFKTWFDSEFYRKLYAKRNDQEAEAFVHELIQELKPTANASMLDLGCGNGRHARHLAARGFNVTGLDLAFSSIREAKKSETETLHFHRHDMRVPFGEGHFDFVFNFFTSFGYFSAGENNQVIRNIANALRQNGIVIIDFMNVVNALKALIAEEERDIDGILYRISRWTDEHYIYKKIAVDNGPGKLPLTFTEKVLKLYLYDFARMFEENGLRLIKVFGDYVLSSYDVNKSSRLILMGQKIR
jgi:SAM-dependent methyltransferase